jgi:hypothetical protein
LLAPPLTNALLESLNADLKNRISLDDFVQFAASKRLTFLGLSVTEFADEDLIKISSLTELCSLTITNLWGQGEGAHSAKSPDGITHNGIENLTKLVKLTHLELGMYCCGPQLCDESLEHISRMQHLSQLILDGWDSVTGVGFQSICKLTGLKTLWLRDSWNGINLTADEIAPLRNLVRLVDLVLWDVPGLSDAHLKHISECRALMRLSVGSFVNSGFHCENPWAQNLGLLRSLKHLETLRLAEVGEISGDALANDLGCFRSLRELAISGWCGVSNRDIWALRTISGLRQLQFQGSVKDFNAGGLRRLEQAMVNCNVQCDLKEGWPNYGNAIESCPGDAAAAPYLRPAQSSRFHADPRDVALAQWVACSGTSASDCFRGHQRYLANLQPRLHSRHC